MLCSVCVLMQVCACARLTHTDIVRVCQSVSGIDAGFPFGASDRKIPQWERKKRGKNTVNVYEKTANFKIHKRFKVKNFPSKSHQ